MLDARDNEWLTPETAAQRVAALLADHHEETPAELLPLPEDAV